MNFLFFGPDHHNSTDGVIIQGMIKLLNSVYSNYTYTYVLCKDFKEMTAEELHKDKKYDAVFVCGTPWLWDQFDKSPKWRNLERCFEAHPEAKKVFFGVGTCIDDSWFTTDILERESEQNAIKKHYKDALVIVRDSYAKDKLVKAGINSHHLVCPSYFCYGLDAAYDYNNTRNVLIYYAPQIGVSRCTWPKSKLDVYNQFMLDFYNEYNPEVYCAQHFEVSRAKEIGLPEPTILCTWKDTLKVMQNANYVLSGRVHCSVPALVKGSKLGLIRIDSRCKVVSDFAGEDNIVNSLEDVKKLKKKYLNSLTFSHYETYNKLLTGFIGC